MVSIKKSAYENLIADLGKLLIITNEVDNDIKLQSQLDSSQVTELVRDIDNIIINMFYQLTIKGTDYA